MRRKFFVLLAIIGLTFAVALGQQPSANAPSVDRLRQIVTYLASDPLEGRRTGTAGATEAANFIAGEFKRLGLEKGMAAQTGNTRGLTEVSYLQPFPYVSGVELGEKNLLSVNPGKADDMMQFKVGDDWMPLGFSTNGSINKIETVFAGYGISSSELKYNDYALSNAKTHFAVNAAVSAALDRVRARVAPKSGVASGGWVAAGEAGLLRDFDSFARERGELGGHMDFDSERVSVSLQASGALDASDDQSVRADGSYVTAHLGNWLVSAHMLERFWGPSHESSLILSNNARPMPTLMIERAEARPLDTRLLSWLGPWRMSFGVSQMESGRKDIDSPLFLAWRVEVMPFHKIELGFSRTAQFCGEELKCDLSVFGNLLIGNDNIGFNTTRENEPGSGGCE